MTGKAPHPLSVYSAPEYGGVSKYGPRALH